MTCGFEFHPAARTELFDGAEWYDEREFGVGARCEVEVREAVDAAVDTSLAWPVWPGWDREPVGAVQGAA